MKNSIEHLCLIGMSGAGKTFWAKELEYANYQRISCDDLIVQALLDVDPIQVDPIDELGIWLGYPWGDDFKEREAQYLDAEIKFMDLICKLKHSGKTVIDTAGSLIYCPDELLEKLKEKYLMVYLKLTDERKEELTNDYLASPRPIVWNNRYQPNDSENPLAGNFKQQYLDLIDYREKRYEKYADFEIMSDALSEFKIKEDFLGYINERL